VTFEIYPKKVTQKQTAYRHLLFALKQKEINVQEKRVTEIRNIKRTREAVNSKAVVVVACCFFFFLHFRSQVCSIAGEQL